MIVFRHTDSRFHFLWENVDQPVSRWHTPADGPTHYFSDVPDAAWAEFIRHEDITDPAHLATIRRTMWAVEIPDIPQYAPYQSQLLVSIQTGEKDTYPACQAEARRLRSIGARCLAVVSAALQENTACGFRSDGGLKPGPPRTAKTVVLFGPAPEVVGWIVAIDAHPSPEILEHVKWII